jgi:hypothetical protein
MAIKLEKNKKPVVQFPIVTWEETDMGKFKVLEQANGVKVKILKEPSKKWKDKQAARTKIEKELQAQRKIKSDEEKLIQDKMREMAVAALKKEGKI